jgi:phosphoheptose isomerase
MCLVDTEVLTASIRRKLLWRNGILEFFFKANAPRLAEAFHEMFHCVMAGGRLMAFGYGSVATYAQYVSVEFVNPSYRSGSRRG